MDIYGFPMGCNCCQQTSSNNNIQRKNDKNFEILNLKFEIEEMKRNGIPQEEINRKLEELKKKTEELNAMDKEIKQISTQAFEELGNRIEDQKNEITTVQQKILKLENYNKQKELKKTKLLQVDQLKREIERLKKSGVSQEEINIKLKELEDANKELEDIVIDIGENELQEYLERIERLERLLDEHKKDVHTIGVITQNKTLDELKGKIKKMEEKLNVFNITEGYVSVNKRIVRAKDAVDGYDLITKSQFDEKISKITAILRAMKDNNLDVIRRLHPDYTIN